MNTAAEILYSLYLRELVWLAAAIVENCTAIFAAEAKLEPGKPVIFQVPELHTRIFAALVASANLKKLLYTDARRGDGESEQAHRLRQECSARLRELLKNLELKEIRNVKLRNTIEHADEYLAKAAVELARQEGRWSGIAYNYIMANADIFVPPLYPMRVYDAPSRVFRNMEYSIDLGVLHVEAEEIVQKIREAGLGPTGPTGMVFTGFTPPTAL